MNEIDPELLEAELARLRPARPPEHFVADLARRLPAARGVASARPHGLARSLGSWRLLRLLVPAGAAAGVLAILLTRNPIAPILKPADPALPVSAQAALKVDDVEIDHRLIRDFDTVARLPGGEPVRFRCREWLDAVVVRDSARNVSIERSTPRVEVVPVRFEIY